ncbi:MAG: hypothetical protein KIT14_17260 [bacterium]|nr:hypothetical protein [bacterium]
MSSPLRSRPELVASQRARPPFGERTFALPDPAVRVGVTGTGDDLLLLPWSAGELAREIEAGAVLFRRLGIAPGMRVANTLPGALTTPGALLVGDVNEAIGALDVPLGEVDAAAAQRGAWDLVDRVECAVLILEPASAAAFLAAAPEVPRPWWQGIVWLARGTWPLATPAVPATFAGWQRSWLAVPEVTSFAAASCARAALHCAEGVVAEAGADGLVLSAPGAPWRYASGVATRVGACDCGTPGAALLA